MQRPSRNCSRSKKGILPKYWTLDLVRESGMKYHVTLSHLLSVCRTISMAKKFPHAEVIGIDLIPRPFDSEATPKNCSFQKRDANEVMEDMYNQFDLIHMRLVASVSRFLVESEVVISNPWF